MELKGYNIKLNISNNYFICRCVKMENEEVSIIILPNGKQFKRKAYSEYTKDELCDVIGYCRNITHVTKVLKIHASYTKYINEFIHLNNVNITHFTIKERTTVPLEDRLVKDSPGVKSYTLKNYLVNTLNMPYKCSKCKVTDTWEDLPINLQLDHINGDNYDNRVENLRLFCPNCHSQTDTYAGKNMKQYERKTCTVCNKQIHNNNTCGKCGDCLTKEKEQNMCIECKEHERDHRYLLCKSCRSNKPERICTVCNKPITRTNNKTTEHYHCSKNKKKTM